MRSAMRLNRKLSLLKSNLFHKDKLDHDLDQEMQAFIDQLTDEKIRGGLSPAEARREALIETGGVELVKEQVRDTRAFEWLHGVCLDVLYAIRSLRKSGGFTAVAVLSLALGIGANATIFSAFYSVLLRPLPYRDPARLFSVARVAPDESDGGVMSPELVAWRNGNRVFEGLAAWDDDRYNLTGVGTPERLVAATVTSNFLEVLGVRPVFRSSFVAEDGHPGAPRVVALGNELWQRRFGADPSVVGRAILLNDLPATVIGVLPASFRFPGELRPDLLSASQLPAVADWGAQRIEGFNAIGRLRAGSTPGTAAADLTSISSSRAALGFLEGWGGKNTHVQVSALQEQLAGNTRQVLRILLAAVGLLFLIACVNVASLQLGRVAIRGREIALRSALGASRTRLVRLLLMENLVLAFGAGLAGLIVASLLCELLSLSSGVPLRDPRDLQLNWVSAATAFILSLLVGVLIGSALAVLAPRMNLNQVLKQQAPAALGDRGAWVRSALVLSQVALALVLLIGSGLLLRSLQAVLAVNPGFRPDGVLTAGVRLPDSRYPSDVERHAFVQALVERLRAMPGVETAAVSDGMPLAGYSMIGSLRTEGQAIPKRGTEVHTPIVSATPEYFHAMGIALQSGRPFDARDTSTSPRVALVNLRFAQRFFRTTDVIGKRVQAFHVADDAPWIEIIGVVANTRHDGLERGVSHELYVPETQQPARNLHIAIRTTRDPLSLADELRSAVWSLDKDLPVNDIASMNQRLSKSGSGRTLQTSLLTSFAGLALLLAAIGIYGVVSEVVNQRTREIGLRMALGAQASSVLRMVMKRSLALAFMGIAAGTFAGRYLSKYLESLLFGTKPTDLATLLLAGTVLLAFVVIAGLVPARRASRIDPVAALRCD